MKKIRWFLGIFNYSETYYGLVMLCLAVGCIFGIIGLMKGSDPLPLRIFGSLLMLVGVLGCYVIGSDKFKRAYEHLKYRDKERLLYRVPSSHDDK